MVVERWVEVDEKTKESALSFVIHSRPQLLSYTVVTKHTHMVAKDEVVHLMGRDSNGRRVYQKRGGKRESGSEARDERKEKKENTGWGRYERKGGDGYERRVIGEGRGENREGRRGGTRRAER